MQSKPKDMETITILVDREFKRAARIAAATNETSISTFSREAIAERIRKLSKPVGGKGMARDCN